MFAASGLLRRIAAVLGLAVIALAGCGETSTTPPPKPKGAAVAAEATDDDALAGRYQAAKERIAGLDPAEAMARKGALNELGPDLREIAEKAKAGPLRANASLLLGSLYEMNDDRRSAIAFYRQAADLLPAEIEPKRVLALALAADGQFQEAVTLQQKVVEDDMDDLASWLILGELHLKNNDKESATQAYGAYEVRRKGILDGLVLHNESGFAQGPEDRARCAFALAPASDNGTAMGLLYALKNEPDPKVRIAIASTMGQQHLVGYQKGLEERLAVEDDPGAREAIEWALAEIRKDPVDSRPGPAPEIAADPASATDEAKAPEKGDAAAKGAKASPPAPP
ncbi:MAG: HEAT repeat domain-containing protein [Nannocystaceae bacterium]